MFNDDCKLDESVLHNPHLKEFVIQDNTAALTVTTLLEVQKGLVSPEEAHDRLKGLGFTVNEISWIQGELERITAKYKEEATK